MSKRTHALKKNIEIYFCCIVILGSLKVGPFLSPKLYKKSHIIQKISFPLAAIPVRYYRAYFSMKEAFPMLFSGMARGTELTRSV